MNERMVRIGHGVIFALTFFFAVISLGISASLTSSYNKALPVHHGKAYRDRIRIILVGSVWTTLFTLILLVGFQSAGHKAIWGIFTHLVPVIIGFLLMLIGASAVTALVAPVDCGDKTQTFAHCSMVKNLIAVSWIDVVFLFIAFVLLLAIAFHARAWGGARRQTLYVE